MGVHQGSKHLLLLISLFFVVLGSLMLTVLVLTRPWVKRPQIVSQRMKRPVPPVERKEEPAIRMAVETKRMEKEPLEAGTEEYGKTPAEETEYRDAVFRREIVESDTDVMKKKPAPSEIQESSGKEIPRFPSSTHKVVESEKERVAAEVRTPDRQEKHMSSERGTKADGEVPSSIKPSSSLLVIITVEIPGRRALICENVAMPPIPDICSSSRMTSKLLRCTWAMASSPLVTAVMS